MTRKWNVHPQHDTSDAPMDISIIPVRETVGAHALHDLFAVYLDDLRPTVAAQTLRNYRSQMTPACTFWQNYAPDHDWQIAPETGPALLAYLRSETGLAQNSIRTTVRRVRQFLRWLHTSGRLPIDISGWVNLPAATQTAVHILTTDELTRLFTACQGMSRVRDMTLLAFLIETGARRAEAAALDFRNVQWAASSMCGSAYLEVVKGYRDTDKRRTVRFGEKTGKLLQIMRVVYGRNLLAGSVFELTNSGVSYALGALSKRSGVEFSPHDLRRTFATYWMRHCAAPSPALAEQLLQMQLGHSAKNVTQAHYVRLTHDDVAQHYVSPLDGLELFGL